jgi:AraC-like DNA-binding protein
MLAYTSTSPNAQHPGLSRLPSRQFRQQPSDKTAFAWVPDKALGTRVGSLGQEAAALERGVEITPIDVVSRRAAAWRGVRVEVIQCVTHDKVEFRFRAPWHLLLVYEEGVRDAGETVIGDTRSTLRTLSRKLTFVPAGKEYREWQQPSIRSRVICLYFDPAKLPVDASSAQLSPRLFFENNMVWETAIRLAGAIEDGAEERYSEALGIVVAHELLRTNLRRRSPARGGLAAWQRRIVTNFIEEHLAEPVPLAALASLVRLSTYYFCRAFKQSFGVPPHRYHTLRRIERAKILLANPDQSITETALALGFSETSSFSAAFRHITGTTPTAYRRTAG